MSEKHSNKSSYSDDIQPYACQDNANVNIDDQEGLLRIMSEYNDLTVTSGEAREHERIREEDIKKGIKPPSPFPKYPFFAPENKVMRLKLVKIYTAIMVAFWIFFLGVWPIYWGSMYHRDSRLINLHYLVVLEEDRMAPVSQALALATDSNEMQISASWDFDSNLTEAEVKQLIHKQEYWAAIYVTGNDVSKNLTNAFLFVENVTVASYVRCFYETGRDPATMEAIVEPVLFKFALYFQQALQTQIYPSIIKNLTSEQFAKLQETDVLTSYPIIQYTDGIPVKPVTNGPLQVGLIYIIITTFFEVMWMTQLYGSVAKSALTIHYIIFRMLLSQLNYLFISLAFSCLNAAFQIPMSNTWSGGFGTFWMVSYLTMSAVGGVNQNVSLILFAIFPPLMGFWILFFAMVNISATFAPIPLCPEFYRFTYAMPIKNAYELMKVVLFNTSHKDVGRCFGTLIAWIVANNLLLPICMAFFSWNMKKKITKQTQQELQNQKNQKNQK